MLPPTIIKDTKVARFDIKNFKASHSVFRIVDLFELQLGELFEILNPPLLHTTDFSEKQKEYIQNRLVGENLGNWVYFPWSGELVHILGEEEYLLLRTNRNKNLINEVEQKRLSEFSVAIAGMSVGSHIATALVYGSVVGSIKLADFDKLSTSNLNRVRAKISDVNKPKIDIITEQLFNINPYLNIQAFEKGVKDENIDDFFTKDFQPKIIIELIDDFKMKVKLRIQARRRGIPLLMFTNLGDNILVDVERYDLNPKLELFNGLVGTTAEEILDKPISEEQKKDFAVKLVGRDHVPVRAIETLEEINKTLVGRPQLYSTVTAMSGIAAYLIRKIGLGEKVESGRKFIKLESFLPEQNK